MASSCRPLAASHRGDSGARQSHIAPSLLYEHSIRSSIDRDLHGEGKDALESDWESPRDLTLGVVER